MGRSKEFDENVVLQKAMELFWKQGYEKTSLNDLVEHMGIHRRSLYDTFGDKRTLFLKTMDFYEELIRNKIQAGVLKAETAKQAIRFIFDFIIEGYEDKQWGCLTVNSATELALMDKEIKERIERTFMQTEQLLADLIRKGQQAGEISREYEPEVLAEVLHNTLHGIRVQLRISASKEKLHRIGNFFMDLLNK
ncbi:TetR/AcrR family transcriptional repressor of nem operon [Clostridium saccharoperbutylacetonicum]|uniref:Putative HTH-type transcriptional regulator YezE n=1 Tax=Clostridium saccharoperbutylacetonicum N1-4(HMT) TaxID=931276 RepID=M1LS98_9CLOT|nr:TetR/AcrR family transcriptional regulator [Clostridium saccharoperbutylacetonicum]AGF55820.1 putative HTH-type transcriptional regulator YezE [Clostridium saccharoperbutylacetonicum N1-4(HMT)]NRT63446.1 TetR/AcrR family transcriptional repressor of nem operon [Clostridium saccharoperbutylacetonicum]NSB26808.1 TetR/AcrR family transcriptional repressor of nem operon [Clostridium saccharoperbutylacetonicum]NSB40288.1 TetR/AcrR family transcriptional repressor of nem operon [Clostridium saccha